MAVGVVQQTVNQAFSIAGTLFSLSGLREGQSIQTGAIARQTETIETLKKELTEKQKEIEQIPVKQETSKYLYSKHLLNLIKDPEEKTHNLENDLLETYSKEFENTDFDPKVAAKIAATDIRLRYNQIRESGYTAGFDEAKSGYLPEIEKLRAEKADADAQLAESRALETSATDAANAWRSKYYRGINRQDEMANRSLLNAQIKKQRGARYR